ncbi:formyltetrahydrofolate deformylase [Rhodohalobacter sulfatireducens]|uniref:Formyltetrahydrofolate deformylase n=1 Tax=Rhodohalobacter sulfatireducens TaxID=2911366 RepID=A0ABS9KGE9_9BACT|nr:formyltetrahydrofolate deformylase [Rhodohalobacter sulfatireducens]MCG2589921.1 formyltetrahydrofolate deformylase [Rhodohalobacter sulfatireducens]
MSKQLVLIDCPDAKGLVYNITKVIYDLGLNIISNHEYVDSNSGYFFMRTVLEGSHPEEQFREKLSEVLPGEANIRLSALRKKPIVILATKEPHCLGDLLLRNADDELPCDIKAVISNHDHLRKLTESFEIPYHHISSENRSREEHEQKILACLDQYEPDYLVLAKYMRIFTPQFVKHYPHRIINIHHSFLPAFIGASPYQQAFDRGVKIIGSTSHFVTENLDEGPIIVQDVIPVNHTFTAEGMAQAGRDIEKNVLAKSLKLVLENRVFIFKDKTIVFD